MKTLNEQEFSYQPYIEEFNLKRLEKSVRASVRAVFIKIMYRLMLQEGISLSEAKKDFGFLRELRGEEGVPYVEDALNKFNNRDLDGSCGVSSSIMIDFLRHIGPNFWDAYLVKDDKGHYDVVQKDIIRSDPAFLFGQHTLHMKRFKGVDLGVNTSFGIERSFESTFGMSIEKIGDFIDEKSNLQKL